MTAIFVFAALVVANIAYTIYDNRRIETARQMDDYYRVEFKKSYSISNENNVLSSWF